MKHYKNIIHKEIVTNLVSGLSHVECDKCGKEIVAGDHDSDSTRYIDVHTWHNDWGNDSVESHEHIDLCPDCAAKFVASYILRMEGTMQIECSIEHAWSGDKRRSTISREKVK